MEEESNIVYKFDSSKHDLVLDLKTLSEIPFDPDTSGIKTFKAFVFEKGKAVHYPQEAGKYIVSGEWREQWILCVVHFKEETKRKPEFLLNFVDYGMLSTTMSGVSVETLLMPLKKAKNVYQDTPRLTQIDDVAGFSPIDPACTPWSVNLAPCLKKLPQFVLHDITAHRHLLEWVKKKTLRQQFTKLEVAARKAITTEVEAMRRQDESQADKIAQMFLARLKSTMASLNLLPPEAYEVEDRIVVLTPDNTANEPQSLESPLRKKVLGGKCGALVRTQLAIRAAAAQTTEPTPLPVTLPVLSPIRELDRGEDAVGSADELEGDGEVEAMDVRIVGSRARKSTNRFEPEVVGAKRKPKAGGEEPDVVDVDTVSDAAPWGINPRTSLPYKRKPYREKDPVLSKLAKAAKAANADKTKPKTPPLPAVELPPRADTKQLQSLKEKVTSLQLQVATLKQELAVSEAGLAAAKAQSRAEGIESVRQEVAAAMLEAKNEYKAGLQDGAALVSRGQKFVLSSSRAGSSAQASSVGSSKHKRRAQIDQSLSESDE